MKILVFDDNPIHRAAAVAQLGVGHDLTVVGTYDEAQKLTLPHFDWEKADWILKKQFGDFNAYRSDDDAKKKEYFHAKEVAQKTATTYPDFDVVLTDLLVPASDQQQASYELVGSEMPVGIFIGLLAAVKGRAKFVAVFTDSDHHAHPASACFDRFNAGESTPTPFMVEGSKFLLSNTRNWVEYFDPNDLSKPLEYEQYKGRTDTVRTKNWTALLKYLLGEQVG